MKKLLVGLLITILLLGITGTTAYGCYTLSGKLAAQANSKYHIPNVNDLDYASDLNGNIDNGIFISGDLLVDVKDNLKLGGGIGFSSLNRLQDLDDNSFLKLGHIPIYMTARYEIPLENGPQFYLIGKIGYSFLLANIESIDNIDIDNIDLKGGLYYEIGAGLTFREIFFVESTFSANWGSLTNNSSMRSTSARTVEVKTSAINLGFGVNLDL